MAELIPPGAPSGKQDGPTSVVSDMRIEIWSDVVCPWCYIGKRRLEKALADFEHADSVEITWHSFELDPTAPAEPTESVAEHLGRKYGGGEAAGRQMVARVTAVATEEGLSFERYPDASRFAKAKRAEPESKDCAIRVVFAPNALAAEEALMNPREAPPRTGDDY